MSYILIVAAFVLVLFGWYNADKKNNEEAIKLYVGAALSFISALLLVA